MPGRRSGRLPTLSSPLSLLAEVEPARRAIAGSLAGVTVGGATYAALEAAMGALDRLAAELGHPGRFHARAL